MIYVVRREEWRLILKYAQQSYISNVLVNIFTLFLLMQFCNVFYKVSE